MAILSECPYCHRKQSVKNKKCKGCEGNLDSAKKARKVKYWISYTLPGGKQKRESVSNMQDLDGFSIKDAEKAMSKRTTQKAENKVLDILPESKITFGELADWYLELKQIQNLSSYRRIDIILKNFNQVFKDVSVNTIVLSDLTGYQEKRIEEGASPRTVDYEISVVKTMINRAVYDNKVKSEIPLLFKPIPKKLKSGANARKRVITIAEYQKLLNAAPYHLKGILTVAYHTGMRQGEIFKLRWSMYDRDAGFLRLPETITKEGKPKDIPINHHVEAVLKEVPRSIKHDYIFMYNGTELAEGAVKKSFRTCCKNAQIPHGRKVQNGITFHDIRRSVKTNMLVAGINQVHRDVILGHTLKGMDVHYLVVNDEALTKAIDQYTKWFDDQVKAAISNNDQNVDQTAVK